MPPQAGRIRVKAPSRSFGPTCEAQVATRANRPTGAVLMGPGYHDCRGALKPFGFRSQTTHTSCSIRSRATQPCISCPRRARAPPDPRLPMGPVVVERVRRRCPRARRASERLRLERRWPAVGSGAPPEE